MQPPLTRPSPRDARLPSLLRRLIDDEVGLAATSELILMSVTIVGIVIVGAAVTRDSLVQELNDWAISVGALNQSYQTGSTSTLSASGSGSGFFDQNDVGDSTGIEFFPVCGLDDPSPTNILE